MPWSRIVGHEEAIARLRGGLAAGRLHPCLLFEGPEGIGKRLVALTLAQAAHCSQAPSRGGDPCGVCRVCLAIDASASPERTADNQTEHPGVRVVTQSRPDERETRFGGGAGRGDVRSQITVPQVRVVLAEGLARGFSRGPRFVIIDPADAMGESAANALLKTLEEPPDGERFILVTSRPSALLPTVVSRSVRHRFGLLSPVEVRRALEAAKAGGPLDETSHPRNREASPRTRGPAAPAVDLDLIASLAGGRVGRGLALAEGPLLARYRETRDLLCHSLEALSAGLPGGTFAVVAGASFRAKEREDWIFGIGVLEALLRDLAVLRADPAASLVNADVHARLALLAERLGGRAGRALGVLDAVRSDLRLNVSGRLAAERILLEVARPEGAR